MFDHHAKMLLLFNLKRLINVILQTDCAMASPSHSFTLLSGLLLISILATGDTYR